MKDLNGHYCLATKEHYEKLIEDGYIEFGETEYNSMGCEYLFIDDCDEIDFGNLIHVRNMIPMHLHNNSWVFGSLEHVPNHDNFIKEVKRICTEHKPVERITREILKRDILEYSKSMVDFGRGIIIEPIDFKLDRVADYIEYLEATQKENS